MQPNKTPKQAPGVWIEGEPPKHIRTEWFIAKLDNGDRVVLRGLPEEWSYDYKTADETFYAAKRLKCWMQFPDTDFIPVIELTPEVKFAGEAVKACKLALRDFDAGGKHHLSPEAAGSLRALLAKIEAERGE